MRIILLLLSSFVILSLACLSTTSLPPTIDIQRAIEATLTAWAAQENQPSPETTLAVTPTSTLSLPPQGTGAFQPAPIPVAGSACIPAGAPFEIGLVIQVIDGDTISVLINDQVFPVRYIGIDTPETHAPGEPVERLALEAAAMNGELVDGQIVTLVKDISETDRYGRLLRYVFVPDLDGLFVNYELVRRGYAEAVSYPPDIACYEYFREAEQEAREDQAGLWAPLPLPPPPQVTRPITPPVVITPSPTPPADRNCDPSYPTVCIPPPPPDLDCKDIPYRRFKVLPPDPHNFDGDFDGIGCESG